LTEIENDMKDEWFTDHVSERMRNKPCTLFSADFGLSSEQMQRGEKEADGRGNASKAKAGRQASGQTVIS
jgi:hypothetical protein